MRVVLIKPDEAPQTVEISGSMEDILRLLDCDYAETVTLTPATLLLHSDSAKRESRAENVGATVFFQYAGARFEDHIAGNAVIVGVDDEGEFAEPDLNTLMSAVEAYEKNKDR
ncbi:DUF3846 domain-containing protein [Nocardia vulneris]|uniref:DUF3846 domain-containing protein n=1 Tax=Nocardia vulneris TaxID=1141657 RepID=A0ABR4Z4N0_9NOCA|nr:DUF3846 domain-containing protein [Nocardia vulneris]KIA60247.1 hypothetical protein FG87_38185 [Nocardia vulneris]